MFTNLPCLWNKAYTFHNTSLDSLSFKSALEKGTMVYYPASYFIHFKTDRKAFDVH